MVEKNDISQEARNDEEDFFSFESDKVSDEDIIDLVDIVGEDEAIDITKPEELAKLFDEDESFEIEEQTGLDEENGLVSDETDQMLEENESLEDVETDLDSALKSLELSDETDGEFDFTENELEDALDADALEATVFEHEELESFDEDSEGLSLDTSQEFSGEDLSADIDSVPPEIEMPAGFPGQEAIQGISEEKIEAIITRVVLNVMEKITKETIAPVVEKVISDAIEALKESLESSQG